MKALVIKNDAVAVAVVTVDAVAIGEIGRKMCIRDSAC